MKSDPAAQRKAKILAIKEAIQNGTYQIDAKKVAQRLLLAHLSQDLLDQMPSPSETDPKCR